ncbi:MAG: TetR/AcrR family transcriptional regulator [Acidimicrobiales bacterium]
MSERPHSNRRGRATDERIRDAARQVLVARGLDLTIEDVAEAAGISRMTVHRHVGTRQALLMDVIVEATDRFADGLAAIFDGEGPFADRLVEAFVYVITTARSAPDQQAMALAIADPSTGWGAIDPEGRIMAEVIDFLRPRLAAGAEETPFRSSVDMTLAWLLRQAQLYLLMPGPLGDDVEGLRREVRAFVLPAVLVDPPPPERPAARSGRPRNGRRKT